ncbi:MAG: GNAT family N-acetyltransferase [Thermoplasmata archaeon]
MATDQGSDRGPERTPVPKDRPASVLSVERITHQDVPAICTLYKHVWETEPAGIPPELLKAWQPTPLEFTSWMEGVTYFAARRDGRLVGVIGCELRHGSCHLVRLAVESDARRQGVATALLGAALEWAKRSNSPAVWVDAHDRFTGAALLFKRLGFTESGILHRHDFGEDVRFFERIL